MELLLPMFCLQAMLFRFSLAVNYLVYSVALHTKVLYTQNRVYLEYQMIIMDMEQIQLINYCSLAGTGYVSMKLPKLSFRGKVALTAGINRIALLSIAVGLAVRSTYLMSLFSLELHLC